MFTSQLSHSNTSTSATNGTDTSLSSPPPSSSSPSSTASTAPASSSRLSSFASSVATASTPLAKTTASSMLSYASGLGAYISPLIQSATTAAAQSYTGANTGGHTHNNSGSSAANPAFDRDLDRMYHVKVRPLLDAVDQLRGLLSGDTNIKLPTIVVVGDQSSGKSSVLEALSGVSLPRGQNITTRCPLVLRLINTATSPPSLTESNGASGSSDLLSSSSVIPSSPYAIIGLSPMGGASEERITNLDTVGRKIEEYTSKLAGNNLGVSSQPIYLSVFRYNSPDLTLIDLPGITRNPIGDQPKDIYKQISNVIYQFIEPEESVILNVMPATVDLSTCEGILMAKTVDPESIRTIGVVTKLDLAEKGIKNKLLIAVEQLNLRLGLVAVRNRTAEENERGVSWEVAREMEKHYFKNHSELNSLCTELNSSTVGDNSVGNNELMLGTNNLAILLATIQEQRVRSTLPKIRNKVRDLLMENREKLKLFPPAFNTANECRIRLDQLFNNLMQQISALSRGDHTLAQGNTKLHLSPRCTEFYTKFQSDLNQNSSKYLHSSYSKIVEEEIKENSACLPNFLSQQVFKSLILKELQKYHTPALNCIENVKNLISYILIHLIKHVFTAFPLIQQRLISSVQQYLENIAVVVNSRYEELTAAEEDIFTLNNYYMDTLNKIKAILYDKLYGPNKNAKGGVPSQQSFMVNDLQVNVDLNQLTILAYNNNNNGASSSSSAPVVGGASFPSITLANSVNTVLEMQMNCFTYSQLIQKRLVDNLSLLLRYHFIRNLVLYNDQGLYPHIQKQFNECNDKQIMELMREDTQTAAKREKLTNLVNKLEKANQVFESI